MAVCVWVACALRSKFSKRAGFTFQRYELPKHLQKRLVHSNCICTAVKSKQKFGDLVDPISKSYIQGWYGTAHTVLFQRFSKDSAGGQVGYPKTSQALDSCVETTETSLRCVNEWTQQNSSATPEADAHWLATWISRQAPLLEWTEGSVHLPTSDTWDTQPLLASRHPWEGCRSHVCPMSCLPALADVLNTVKYPQKHQTSMFSVMWWQWELQWNPSFCDFW